jgi:anti-sigma-K factor RskA
MGDIPNDDEKRPGEADGVAELLPAYALGILSEAERAEVEAYLQQDEQGRQELAALEAVAAQLPLLVEEREPPASLRQRLLAAAEADLQAPAAPAPLPPPTPLHPPASQPTAVQPPPTPPPAQAPPALPARREPTPLPRRFRPSVLAASVLLLLSLGLGAWNLVLQGRLTDQQRLTGEAQARLEEQRGQNAQLQAQNSQLQNQTAQLQGQLSQAQAQVKDLEAQPRVTIYTVSGTKDAPNASGEVVYVPQNNTAFLTVRNLPAAPAGRAYQVWFVPQGGQPVDAGLLAPAPSQAATRLQADLGQYQAIAVSVEPTGGSPQPTGPIVLLAPLSAGNA